MHVIITSNFYFSNIVVVVIAGGVNMKFIIIEIGIIALGVICFFTSSLILDSFESNVIEIEYGSQTSIKLDDGKYYLYQKGIHNIKDHLQSENQGIITTVFDMSICDGCDIYSGVLTVSKNSEIVNVTPELTKALEIETLNAYLFASFKVENDADYDISYIYTNISGGQSMYIPNLTLTSTNPKIISCFEWIHDNIAFVTLAAMFISGVIYVNIPDKKRSNV